MPYVPGRKRPAEAMTNTSSNYLGQHQPNIPVILGIRQHEASVEPEVEQGLV